MLRRSAALFLAPFALAFYNCGGQSTRGGDGASSGGQDGSPSSFGEPSVVEQHILAVNAPRFLASDGADLFWLDTNGGVWRDPIGGGNVTQLASDASWTGGFIFVDSTNVYFAQTGGIVALPKAGSGAIATLVPISSDAIFLTGTVSNGTVYWIEIDTTTGPKGGSTPTIKSAPLAAGSAAMTLGALSMSDSPNSVAVVGKTVFFAAPGSQVGMLEDDGGAPNPTNAVNCTSPLLAGTNGIYCSDTSILFVMLDGSTTTISPETGQAATLAADATNVYWAAGGTVATAPRQGGATVTIASGDSAVAVAVDDTAVYWSDQSGDIQKAMKQ